jgi:hypothetical protein
MEAMKWLICFDGDCWMVTEMVIAGFVAEVNHIT